MVPGSEPASRAVVQRACPAYAQDLEALQPRQASGANPTRNATETIHTDIVAHPPETCPLARRRCLRVGSRPGAGLAGRSIEAVEQLSPQRRLAHRHEGGAAGEDVGRLGFGADLPAARLWMAARSCRL